MKNSIAFLGLLTLMILASCKDKVDDTQSQTCPALDLYCKYACNENLTVAYLGDFSIKGCKIDALMIQANEEEDWEQLKAEFGMYSEADSLYDPSANPEAERKVSVGLEIDANFILELGLDTITDLSQVDEERFDRLTQIITDKMREVVNNFALPDTTMPSDEYFNALAVVVANNLLSEVVEKNSAAVQQNDAIDASTVDTGNIARKGYVSAADNDKHTIWLFFYDNQEECNNILTHIKDDIILRDAPSAL